MVARQRDSGSLAEKASCQNGHEMLGENLRIKKKNKDVIFIVCTRLFHTEGRVRDRTWEQSYAWPKSLYGLH